MVVLKRSRFEYKVKLRDCLNNGKCFSDILKIAVLILRSHVTPFPLFFFLWFCRWNIILVMKICLMINTC